MVLPIVFLVIIFLSDENFEKLTKLVDKQSDKELSEKELIDMMQKQTEQSIKAIESFTKPGGLLDKNASLLEFLRKVDNDRDNKINHQVEKLDAKIIETVELIENNSLLEARINALMINWRELRIPQDQELKSHYEDIRKKLIESINNAENK